MKHKFSKLYQNIMESDSEEGIAEEVDGLFYFFYVLMQEAIDFEEKNDDPQKENKALKSINRIKDFITGRMKSEAAQAIIKSKRLDDVEKGESVVKLRSATMDLFKTIKDKKRDFSKKQDEADRNEN